jgi:hypothetical protein
VIPAQEEEDSVAVEVEVVDAAVDVALAIVGDSVVVVVEVVEGDVVHPVVDVVVECLHSKEGRLHSKPRLSGTLNLFNLSGSTVGFVGLWV